MTPAGDSALFVRLPPLLRRELTLDPWRVRSIARIATGTAIAVAMAMVFQIPLPAYVAYLIFLLSQEDVASTLISAVGGLAAATLAIALSLLFYVFDASEPALRIPLLALSASLGSFLSRTSTLGPIAFLAGFVLVLSQTLIDDVPSPEALTHIVLWLWVVVATPVFIVILLNLLFGENPVTLARQRAAALMDAVADYIETPSSADPSLLRAKLIALGQLTRKAILWNKQLKTFAAEDQRLTVLMLEILQIARSLPSELPLSTRQALSLNVRQSRSAFLKRRGIDSETTAAPVNVECGTDIACAALGHVLRDLHDEASGRMETATPAGEAKPTRHLLVPDAFSNPAYVRYALKVTFAVLASYATYTLLDWPGIRTAVTTCFFVSLTTFGESAHKLVLRLSGAILGGLLGGLCLVFVIPALTDIGQLCLLVVAVSVLCAWVSTSSENISYAGMQMAFAFFLGVLQGYEPASDLTVLRDRVIGIVIGNLWISIFFTALWPISALQQARQLWSSVLEKLGALLMAPTAHAAQELHLDISNKLQQASLLKSRSLFEAQLVLSQSPPDSAEHQAAAIEQVASSTFVLHRLQPTEPSPDAMDQSLSQRLLLLSKGTPGEPLHPPQHDPIALVDRARLRLNEEIDHATRLP
jgi:multidrug resistance protein MdtO